MLWPANLLPFLSFNRGLEKNWKTSACDLHFRLSHSFFVYLNGANPNVCLFIDLQMPSDAVDVVDAIGAVFAEDGVDAVGALDAVDAEERSAFQMKNN